MEYLIISAFQLLGVFFHVGQKVKAISDSTPDETESFGSVMSLFWKSDYLTVILSAGILALHILIHFVVEVYAASLRESIPYYILWSFAIALIMGYAGQRLIYGWLGKGEKLLDQKVNSKLQ